VCSPSIRQISTEWGINKNTVIKAIKRLELGKIVEVIHHEHRLNSYRIDWIMLRKALRKYLPEVYQSVLLDKTDCLIECTSPLNNTPVLLNDTKLSYPMDPIRTDIYKESLPRASEETIVGAPEGASETPEVDEGSRIGPSKISFEEASELDMSGEAVRQRIIASNGGIAPWEEEGASLGRIVRMDEFDKEGKELCDEMKDRS
jgi:hypothetical protein